MATYNFSMERVLEWRTNIEKSTVEKFAAIQNDLQLQKSILSQLVREYENLKDKATQHKNIQELRQEHYYKQTIEDRIEKQNELIFKTSENLECVRLELVLAQKDRRIMEKVKEKDYTLHMDNIKAMEQRELDEIAVLRAATRPV